jgi:hypothetical protein
MLEESIARHYPYQILSPLIAGFFVPKTQNVSFLIFIVDIKMLVI